MYRLDGDTGNRGRDEAGQVRGCPVVLLHLSSGWEHTGKGASEQAWGGSGWGVSSRGFSIDRPGGDTEAGEEWEDGGGSDQGVSSRALCIYCRSESARGRKRGGEVGQVGGVLLIDVLHVFIVRAGARGSGRNEGVRQVRSGGV